MSLISVVIVTSERPYLANCVVNAFSARASCAISNGSVAKAVQQVTYESPVTHTHGSPTVTVGFVTCASMSHGSPILMGHLVGDS